MADLPTLQISSITLTPAHRVDSVNVIAPVASVVTRLVVTLTVTLTRPGSPDKLHLELTNDFLAEPIFVLAQSALAAAS